MEQYLRFAMNVEEGEQQQQLEQQHPQQQPMTQQLAQQQQLVQEHLLLGQQQQQQQQNIEKFNYFAYISEQPKSCFRFRYARECGVSHGILYGETTIGRDLNCCYPTVRLQLDKPTSSNNIYVLCLLYESTQESKDLCVERKPSANYLMEKIKNAKKKPKRKRKLNSSPTVDDDSEMPSSSSSPSSSLSSLAVNHIPDYNFKPIWRKMTKLNSNEFEFQLENFFIVKSKQLEKVNILNKMREEIQKLLAPTVENDDLEKFLTIYNHHDAEQVTNRKSKKTNKSENRVVIGFTFFIDHQNGQKFRKLETQTIFTKEITSENGFYIDKLYHPTGYVGDEIALMVTECNRVRIQLSDENNPNEWSWLSDVIIPRRKLMVEFKMPLYDGPNRRQQEISLILTAIRDSDEQTADATFIYKNLEASSSQNTKRARLGDYDDNRRENALQENNQFFPIDDLDTDATTTTSSMNTKIYRLVADSTTTTTAAKMQQNFQCAPRNEPNSIKKIINKIISTFHSHFNGVHQKDDKILLTKINKINNDYAIAHENGNTFLHDAILEADILNLIQLDRLEIVWKELMPAAENYHKRNLLHYVCLNKSAFLIRHLVGVGCSIYARDINQETPFQIAMRLKSAECIKQFIGLIRDRNDYPNLTDDIMELLNVYDRHGYTILHHAVMETNLPLVESLLNFCLAEGDIDPCGIKTLKCGDTILHLAIQITKVQITESIKSAISISDGKPLKLLRSFEMVKLILAKYPDADCYTNYAGHTAYEMQELSKKKNNILKMMKRMKIEKTNEK